MHVYTAVAVCGMTETAIIRRDRVVYSPKLNDTTRILLFPWVVQVFVHAQPVERQNQSGPRTRIPVQQSHAWRGYYIRTTMMIEDLCKTGVETGVK